jgi:hypothetical protein
MYGYHSQGDIDSFVAIASHVAHVRGVQLDRGYPLIEKAQHAASATGINTGMGEFQEFVQSFYAGSMTGQEVYDATIKLIAEKATVQAPPPQPIGTPEPPSTPNYFGTPTITSNKWSGNELIVCGVVAPDASTLKFVGYNAAQHIVTESSKYTFTSVGVVEAVLDDPKKEIRFVKIVTDLEAKQTRQTVNVRLTDLKIVEWLSIGDIPFITRSGRKPPKRSQRMNRNKPLLPTLSRQREKVWSFSTPNHYPRERRSNYQHERFTR